EVGDRAAPAAPAPVDTLGGAWRWAAGAAGRHPSGGASAVRAAPPPKRSCLRHFFPRQQGGRARSASRFRACRALGAQIRGEGRA
ncbi:MAG TPA: hypothetical protein VM076_25480, partial [Gemmatimonadaceae bacterium]|nr:hypothetical protein [Gemmatimonadaceae bacterium]